MSAGSKLLTLAAVVTAIMLFLIGSCVWNAITTPPIVQGYITEKEFTPEHTTTVYIPQYSTVCDNDGCTQQFTGLLPITTYHPDRWALRIKNGDRHEWVTIVEVEYNEWQVDNFWVRPPPTDE